MRIAAKKSIHKTSSNITFSTFSCMLMIQKYIMISWKLFEMRSPTTYIVNLLGVEFMRPTTGTLGGSTNSMLAPCLVFLMRFPLFCQFLSKVTKRGNLRLSSLICHCDIAFWDVWEALQIRNAHLLFLTKSYVGMPNLKGVTYNQQKLNKKTYLSIFNLILDAVNEKIF